MSLRLLSLIVASLALAAGCQLVLSTDSPWPEELEDAGESPDAGESSDAGEPSDAGEASDAGEPSDGGGPDAGPTCGQTGDSCSASQPCCEGFGCRASNLLCAVAAGPGLPDGFLCRYAGDCSNGYCRSGVCANPDTYSCRGAGWYCSSPTASSCCKGTSCRLEFPSACVVEVGEPCLGSDMCRSLNCGDDGICAEQRRPPGAACVENCSCQSGNCEDGVCVKCIANGSSCVEHITCCSQYCSNGTCQPYN